MHRNIVRGRLTQTPALSLTAGNFDEHRAAAVNANRGIPWAWLGLAASEATVKHTDLSVYRVGLFRHSWLIELRQKGMEPSRQALIRPPLLQTAAKRATSATRQKTREQQRCNHLTLGSWFSLPFLVFGR
jgi:hypothetical protein